MGVVGTVESDAIKPVYLYLRAHPRFSASASTMSVVTTTSSTFCDVLNSYSAYAGRSARSARLEKRGLSPSAMGRKRATSGLLSVSPTLG